MTACRHPAARHGANPSPRIPNRIVRDRRLLDIQPFSYQSFIVLLSKGSSCSVLFESLCSLAAASTMAADLAIPPGGTLLDTFKKSFVDVPIDAEKDNAISTTEFLDAATALTTMFG